MYYGHVSTASNRADWQEAIVLTDEETGELIDISACRVTLTLARCTRSGGDYNFDMRSPALLGSTDAGDITLPDVGTFLWTFDEHRMASLVAGEYMIGVRISQDDRTVQLIIGTVDIVEGIDTQ